MVRCETLVKQVSRGVLAEGEARLTLDTVLGIFGKRREYWLETFGGVGGPVKRGGC